MSAEFLLLRFEDRLQAVAMLEPLGAVFSAVEDDGVLYRPTGETVQFEGESIALTCPTSGYHVRLAWEGDLPSALHPFLVTCETRARRGI